MRKIIFGYAAAISSLINLSATNTVKVKAGRWYWFQLKSNFLVGSAVPAMGNMDLYGLGSFDMTATPDPPDIDPCSGTTYYCLAGFSSDQMTSGLKYINTTYGFIVPDAGVAYSRD